MAVETLLTLIIAAVPSVVAICAIIVAVLKVIKKFEETRKAVLDAKEYQELKKELEIAHAENRELKKKINTLLSRVERIIRPPTEE